MKIKNTLRKGLHVAILAMMSCVGMQAQSLFVLKNDLQVSEFKVNDVKSLSFEAGKLIVKTPTGANSEISLGDIRHLSFVNHTGGSSAIDQNKSAQLEQLKCYPNPATSVLNIETLVAEGNANVQVLSSEGKVVISKETVLTEGAYRLNVEGLSQGIYFVKVKTEKRMEMASFIKK